MQSSFFVNVYWRSVQIQRFLSCIVRDTATYSCPWLNHSWRRSSARAPHDNRPWDVFVVSVKQTLLEHCASRKAVMVEISSPGWYGFAVVSSCFLCGRLMRRTEIRCFFIGSSIYLASFKSSFIGCRLPSSITTYPFYKHSLWSGKDSVLVILLSNSAGYWSSCSTELPIVPTLLYIRLEPSINVLMQSFGIHNFYFWRSKLLFLIPKVTVVIVFQVQKAQSVSDIIRLRPFVL